MPYKISAEEIEAVSRLAAPERYAHFGGRVADWQEAWGLRSADGWVGMGDDLGREGVPFWPHPEYAMAFAAGDWASCKAERLSLEDLLGKWLPGMARDGLMAVVFPTPGTKGVMVEPSRLKEDLLTECEKYGDGSDD